MKDQQSMGKKLDYSINCVQNLTSFVEGKKHHHQKQLLRAASYILPQNKNTQEINVNNSNKTKENKVEYLYYARIRNKV